MGLHRLKSFRVGVSVLFFALIAFLFLDFRNIVPTSVVEVLLYLQFVPSLVKFVNAAAPGAAGFIVIVILTVLFGRVYCSTVCPLGTLQDVISFVARKKWKRRDFQFSEPHNVLRYSILTLTVLLLISGSGFLLNLLDPFSNRWRRRIPTAQPVVQLNREAEKWLSGVFPFDSRVLEPKIWNTFTRITLVSKQCCERVTLDVDLTVYSTEKDVRLDNIAIAVNFH